MRRLFPVLLLLLGCSQTGLSWNGDSRVVWLKSDGVTRTPLSATRLQIRASREFTLEILGKKSMALFPGLEFLESDERSSSDRDARGPLADRRRPDMAKVTVPLMAYEADGVLVALMWKDGAK